MFAYVDFKLTCNCGSTKVAKRYIHDFRGEVEGQSLRCLDCDAYDPGY